MGFENNLNSIYCIEITMNYLYMLPILESTYHAKGYIVAKRNQEI
jgi:hypothetical protein